MGNGFNLDLIGARKAQSSLSRWRNTYKTFGEQGFFEERGEKGARVANLQKMKWIIRTYIIYVNQRK